MRSAVLSFHSIVITFVELVLAPVSVLGSGQQLAPEQPTLRQPICSHHRLTLSMNIPIGARHPGLPATLRQGNPARESTGTTATSSGSHLQQNPLFWFVQRCRVEPPLWAVAGFVACQ